MTRVDVNPRMIDWASERSGLGLGELERRFKALPQWRAGDKSPTLRQLEAFAKATLTPLGLLLLDEPPREPLPIPDFRTVGSRPLRRVTAPLLETIHLMQRRQEWLREYFEDIGAEPLAFVGSMTPGANPDAVAASIRDAVGMGPRWTREHPTWEAALLGLRRAAESLRIMVVINGCVGNNTHRTLDPADFRGFVFADSMAPLIFINGADWKAAQMFTLAHELAHLWIGRGAVFNLEQLQPGAESVERFCNQVAAEVLMPAEQLLRTWPRAKREEAPYRFLARHFKVSQVVAARRAFDLGLIEPAEYQALWQSWVNQGLGKRRQDSSGGDFHRSQVTRVGHLFGQMVVRAAREGRILYQDAYRLTGLHGSNFERFSTELGFGPQ